MVELDAKRQPWHGLELTLSGAFMMGAILTECEKYIYRHARFEEIEVLGHDQLEDSAEHYERELLQMGKQGILWRGLYVNYEDDKMVFIWEKDNGTLGNTTNQK